MAFSAVTDLWQVNNTPAAATQATALKAAGAAGVRHVCKRITASVAAAGTASGVVTIVVRDGLTGAGAVLWSAVIGCIINGGQAIDLDNLDLVGTAATGMCVESTAAGAATSVISVTMQGYDLP